jgi:calcium-dependent protein kinase
MPHGSVLSQLAKKPFDEVNAAKILRQLMEVLDYIHTKDYLHLDVKLDSIYFAETTPNPIIKLGKIFMKTSTHSWLGSFGNAQVSANIPRDKQIGTPGYMAPEAFFRNFGGYSAKSDVFSAGIVLYAM